MCGNELQVEEGVGECEGGGTMGGRKRKLFRIEHDKRVTGKGGEGRKKGAEALTGE